MKTITRRAKLTITALLAACSIGCTRDSPPDVPSPPARGAADGADDAGLRLTPTETEEPKTPRVPGARILGAVPDFSLTTQDGESFGSAQLRGKVWVATFIFTRCSATCPAQTARFAKLQERLRNYPGQETIRLVSITVDPSHDTADVLRTYASKAGADLSRWAFLTGARDEIWKLCKNGFKLPVSDADDSESLIAHSQNFILVDRGARIRGYYDGLQEDSVEQLKLDLQSVLNDPPDTATHLGRPQEVIDPPWLEARRAAQLKTVDRFRVFHDFQLDDRLPESGIRFQHRIVEDAGKNFKGNHYDHGNGLAVADVDGDGLYDIYFTTQLGRNELWRNLGAGKFEDITEEAGVGLADRISVTASFADVDNDADPDLYVTTVRGGNALFENDGKGRFLDISNAAGLDYLGHSSAAVFFDFDRDGLLDLFLANVGTYTTDQKGPGDYYIGFTDAFAGHLKPERTERSILFKNMGNNRFVDVSAEKGLLDDSWTGDASPLDLNEDGWPDLYILDMQGHDEYYENVEGKRFVKKSREVFPRTPWGSMGIKVFDYDNDGRLDIFIVDMHTDMVDSFTGLRRSWQHEKEKIREHYPPGFQKTDQNHVHGNAFFHNKGGGKFVEISDRIGAENYWPWGLSVGDLNADGFEDAFITASMNYQFRYQVNSVLLNNQGDGFLDSEFILGVEPRRDGRTAKPWFELDCGGADQSHRDCEGLRGRRVVWWAALGSRSSVIFDVDEDGDLDVVTNEFNSEPMVLISNLAAQRDVHFLKVWLVGTKSNSSGLGAEVRVQAGGKTYVKVQDGQSGYLSQSLYPLYFGLGDAERVDRIEVVWPSGQKQLLEGPIEANRLQTITEP